jgi:cation diffusion facilitator CzcD-associated flavoprotein CzcO
VAVVGTGISGVLCGIILKHNLGLETFELLEKDPAGVGGVWRKQNYPGLSCEWV